MLLFGVRGLSLGRPFFIFASEGSSESSAFMLFVFVPCLSLFLLLILTFNVFFYLATASMWPHVWLNLINMSVIIQEYIGYHGHSFFFNFIKFYKYPKGICYSTCVIEINDFPFNFFSIIFWLRQTCQRCPAILFISKWLLSSTWLGKRRPGWWLGWCATGSGRSAVSFLPPCCIRGTSCRRCHGYRW